MIKHRIDCPYVISKFSNHNQLKENLLKHLTNAKYEKSYFADVETNITKTDWFISKDIDRPWLKEILNPLVSHMQNVYQRGFGYDTFLLKEIWFQQYANKSSHGWHVHGSTFTNIYYVDMPTDSPKTQIINPYNQTDIIELDVNEGDIVSFPSFVLHRAPENKSKDIKTIISFNSDVDYTSKMYNKNLQKESNNYANI